MSQERETNLALFIDFEDRCTLFDTLILCRFYRDLYPWEELGRMMALTTGEQMEFVTPEEIAEMVAASPYHNATSNDVDWVQKVRYLPYLDIFKVDLTEAAMLTGLDQVQPGTDWRGALRLAGGAPLGAIGALEQLDTHASMSKDFAGIAKGRVSPIEAAQRWTKLDTGFVLDWMAREVHGAILLASDATQRPATTAIDESVLKRMDRRNLFCYLDIINRLRGQPKGSFNVQLTLESLLIDWAEGLAQRTTV